MTTEDFADRMFGADEPVSLPETTEPEVTQTEQEVAAESVTENAEPLQSEALEGTEPQRPEPTMIPLHVVQKLRQDIKKRNDEFDQLRAQNEELMRYLSGENAASAGDYYEQQPQEYDPVQAMQIQTMQMNANYSQKFAILQHGQEIVSEAEQWGDNLRQTNPQYFQSLISTLENSSDPYAELIAIYQDQKLLSNIREANVTPDELEEFKKWRALKQQTTQSAAPQQMVQNNQPVPARPKPSLAGEPSFGGNAPVDEDGVFGKFAKR